MRAPNQFGRRANGLALQAVLCEPSAPGRVYGAVPQSRAALTSLFER